jgi:hypothetical protein
MKTYNHPQETWSEEACKKKANRIAVDGMGTPYPFKGYIGSSASIPSAYGLQRYNGGTSIDGVWYEATFRPLPKLAKGYKIINVPSWGWRIVKES